MINCDYNKLQASMQPVITKAVPSDSENDIDLLRNILADHFKNEIDHETGKVSGNKDVQIRWQNNEDRDSDETS